MKNHNEKRFLIFAFIGVLDMLLAGGVMAQTFATLHNFNGSDGASPNGGLILSGNMLYGTAQFGGVSSNGTVFAITTNGTGFTNLHNFTAEVFDSTLNAYTNCDGGGPYCGLVLSGNTLFGTTVTRGTFGNGTVFAVNTDGEGFANLHNFTGLSGGDSGSNSDGANPQAGLTLFGRSLYGTAAIGGTFDNGTIFAINTDGTGFTNLHNFTAPAYDSSIDTYTNGDGSNPDAGLFLYGDSVYGATPVDGSLGGGTVFRFNTDGSGFTNLYNFSHGSFVVAGLIFSGNSLYGTTPQGFVSGGGTIFRLNADGTGFTNLHNFAGSDGLDPRAGLILSSNTLYGTTYGGGGSSYGTVFAINTDGTDFSVLYSFQGLSSGTNADGINPVGGLILSGNNLYGTASGGGNFGNGTIFSLSFAPQLAITASGTNVILTWPTNVAGFDYSGFTLQSTTNLVSTNWSNVLPSPVVMNGQNTVTNAISGVQMFYRLQFNPQSQSLSQRQPP